MEGTIEEVRGRRGSEGGGAREAGEEAGVGGSACLVVVAMVSSGVGAGGAFLLPYKNVRDRGGDSDREGKEGRADEEEISDDGRRDGRDEGGWME